MKYLYLFAEVTIKQLREKIKDLEEKTESTIQVSYPSEIVIFFSSKIIIFLATY